MHVSRIDWRRRGKAVALRCWTYPYLALLVWAFLVHLGSTAWGRDFFYNGDSLTLALLAKSIAAREPFDWVFSSQTFVFPEGVVYGAISLVARTPILALTLNAVVNLVLLYWLVSAIGGRAGLPRYRAQLLGLSAATWVVILAASETTVGINQSAVATLYFYNTYYYGAIVSGLGLVLLAIDLLRALDAGSPGTLPGLDRSGAASIGGLVLRVAGIFALVALTYASNPLFAPQFAGPVVLVLLVAAAVGASRVWTPLLVIAPVALGVYTGQRMRDSLLHNLVAATLDRYYEVTAIPGSLKFLGSTIAEAFGQPETAIGLVLLLAGLLAAVVGAAFAVWQALRRPRCERRQGTGVLVAALMPVAVACGSVATVLVSKFPTTRYLIPLAVVPPLALIGPLAQMRTRTGVERGGRRASVPLAGTLVLLAALPMGVIVGGRNALPSLRPDGQIACMAAYLGDHQGDGVGDYWTSRRFDLYAGKPDQRVLQVGRTLSPYFWLNNKAAYAGRDYRFVVVQDAPEHAQVSLETKVHEEELGALGTPTEVTSCPDEVHIYTYDPGTPGYVELNARMQVQ